MEVSDLQIFLSFNFFIAFFFFSCGWRFSMIISDDKFMSAAFFFRRHERFHFFFCRKPTDASANVDSVARQITVFSSKAR
jgi:hypothetical protein